MSYQINDPARSFTWESNIPGADGNEMEAEGEKVVSAPRTGVPGDSRSEFALVINAGPLVDLTSC